MTKNITVVDENGIKVGSTYPKRALGLVKKGRAHWIDDDTVCLCAHITEENKMADKIYEVIDNQFSKLQERLCDMDEPDKVGAKMIDALTAMQTRNRELDIAEKQLGILSDMMSKDGAAAGEMAACERERTRQKMLEVLSVMLSGKQAVIEYNVSEENTAAAEETPAQDN